MHRRLEGKNSLRLETRRIITSVYCLIQSVAEIHFFRWGAKPSKFPTKLSNFRQTPPFALEKAVFSPLIGQNFRKFVIFHEGGRPPPPPPTPPRFPPLNTIMPCERRGISHDYQATGYLNDLCLQPFNALVISTNLHTSVQYKGGELHGIISIGNHAMASTIRD